MQDRDGAKSVLEVLRHHGSRRLADLGRSGDAGELVTWVGALRPWLHVRLEIVKPPDGTKGFLLLPKRWIVERTFALAWSLSPAQRRMTSM